MTHAETITNAINELIAVNLSNLHLHTLPVNPQPVISRLTDALTATLTPRDSAPPIQGMPENPNAPTERNDGMKYAANILREVAEGAKLPDDFPLPSAVIKAAHSIVALQMTRDTLSELCAIMERREGALEKRLTATNAELLVVQRKVGEAYEMIVNLRTERVEARATAEAPALLKAVAEGSAGPLPKDTPPEVVEAAAEIMHLRTELHNTQNSLSALRRDYDELKELHAPKMSYPDAMKREYDNGYRIGYDKGSANIAWNVERILDVGRDHQGVPSRLDTLRARLLDLCGREQRAADALRRIAEGNQNIEVPEQASPEMKAAAPEVPA